MTRRKLWAIAVTCVVAGGVTSQLNAEPYAVFIVHCEPGNADAKSFLNLSDLVKAADQHQVKLTIDFTPPWARMVLDHPGFLTLVTRWNETGHEIGAHHHPYWISQTRDTRWDGYTNTPQEELSLSNPADYLGDMDQYMALLNQLPGTRTSGTLGINYGQDVLDWPADLLYSSEGHEFNDIVGRPQMVEYAGHVVWQLSHGLFWSATPSQLHGAYSGALSGDIVAVVTHVSNYEESLQNVLAVNNYFSFLGAMDPSGNSLVTVTQAMNLAIPEPTMLSLSMLAGAMILCRRY